MSRRCHAVGVLPLMAAVAMCAQTAGPKAPPPPRNEVRPGAAAKSPAARNPQAPKVGGAPRLGNPGNPVERLMAMPPCLLYTSDAADDLTRVDLGGRRIIKKKK